MCKLSLPLPFADWFILTGKETFESASTVISTTQSLPHKDETVMESPRNLSSGSATKVIILAYFRTGSSLMGEILNHYEGAFYHFEPIRSIARSMYGQDNAIRCV